VQRQSSWPVAGPRFVQHRKNERFRKNNKIREKLEKITKNCYRNSVGFVAGISLSDAIKQ